MRLSFALSAVFAAMLLTSPVAAQVYDSDTTDNVSPDDIVYDDEIVLPEDEAVPDDVGYEPDPECLAFFGDRPDAAERFPRLSQCVTRYAGFDCEPEQNPPEGWLRPGGYCDQVRLAPHKSLVTPVSEPPPPRIYQPPVLQ